MEELPHCTGILCKGLISSKEYHLFEKKRKPEHPVGPCMTRIKGSCNRECRYLKE